ncbi:hypothetical protein DL769_009387 [Monosporascus sp. CRB-8-3]|nr:hypothetical protein DL769_009387 [Monosporascus sp. CRB-8-3]
MPHNISTKKLLSFLKSVPFNKVVKKAQTASVGHRLYPSRTPAQDAHNNFRIDRGHEVSGKFELILQANKNAEDTNVRKAAEKDSHAILAKGLADPANDPEGEAVEKDLVADFERRK